MEITTKTPISAGWSSDKKYCVTDKNGVKYLMRISDMSKYEKKKNSFAMTEKVAALGVPMCQPIEFGTSADGVYSIYTWIDGYDAENVIGGFDADTQYSFGREAGEILKKIHSIPAPNTVEPWSERFNRKIDRKISLYKDCPLKYENGQVFLDYVNANRKLLEDRAQTYQHGDYHIGNMMLDKRLKPYIIDFDRDDYGDPWEEFNRIVWCAEKYPVFASGMVDGYFDGDVPEKFWKLLALYISSNTLSSLPWAVPFGEEEILTMRNQAREILDWYDGMTRIIPKWYTRKTADNTQRK